jgi:short-subunit dehydrogenase
LFLNKTYIITGATHGIGKAISHHLALSNAKLILISRDISELNQIKKQLHHPESHTCYNIDVVNSTNVELLFVELEKEYPCIDGLINCAGSFGTIGKLEDVNPVAFQYAINQNLLGPYNMSYFGLQMLLKTGHGKIINFSGGGATDAFPNYSGYACSKIALVKLTENISIEYPYLDINIVAPGFIKTRLSSQTLEAGKKAGSFYEKTKEMIKEGGVDVVYAIDLVSFLLSSDSDGISGKIISAPWDNWKSKLFQNKLRTDNDFCSLRRIDNRYFTKQQTSN